MAYSNCTVGGSTSLWRTVTAPVKDEDDGDHERASLTCEWRLVPLGGHGDSRASGLAISPWCLLVGTVTSGQADLRVASGASWSARSRQGKQSCDRRAGGHLLDAQQERPLLIWA